MNTEKYDLIEAAPERVAPISTLISNFYEVDRLDKDWPDLPWPDWKPNTTKMMRPDTVTWDVSVLDGRKSYSRITVFGRRYNASGLGEQVSNVYWRNGEMPAFVRDLVNLSG